MEPVKEREDQAFLRQFDAPAAIVGNLLVRIVAVVPISLYVMVAPALMKAYHVGPGSIGTMLSIGMIIASVVALIVGSNAYRLNLRYTAMLGMLVHIAGNVVAVTLGVWAGVVAARAISAIGDAMVLSCANAALSRSRNNTRYWAISGVLTGLGASFGTFALGRTLDRYGPNVFFGAMIVAGLLTFSLLWLLPPFTLPVGQRARRAGNLGARLFASLGSKGGVIVLVGVMLICMGNSAIFNFSAIIGSQAGFSTEQIGAAQSLSYFVVTALNLCIVVIAARFGHARPVLLLAAIFVASAIVMGFAPSYLAYAGSLVAMAAAYRASNPYIYGISAKQDPSGGIPASLVVVFGLGSALGPSFTALMLQVSRDYRYIGIAAAGFFITGAMMLATLAFAHERAARLEAEASGARDAV